MINERVLISFCNTSSSSKLRRKGYSQLGILDVPACSVHWLKLPSGLEGSGITGLTQNRNYIFAVGQAQQAPQILIFEKNGFKVKFMERLEEAKDVHSCLIKDNFLYVVSTGSNQILRYPVERGKIDTAAVEIFWTPNLIGKKRSQHLNAICWHKGSILVSGFGPKVGRLWSTARSGYIFDIGRGEMFVDGIYHPHSLFSDGEELFFCESTTQTLKKGKGKVVYRFLGGYVRGLAKIKQYFIVGLSSGRKVSRSTGIINSISDPGKLIVTCRLVILRENDLEVVRSFDLSFFHKEIYDVLPLDKDCFWDRSTILRSYFFVAR